MRKLEIGSGNRPLAGYEHLDINPCCPCLEYVAEMHLIPVPDQTFDEVISVHVLEHQPWKLAIPTLTEWIRIVKPGGKIRIVTPNFRWIAQTYLNALSGDMGQMQRDLDVMNSGELSWLQINDQIHPSLWANFKVMSSGGKHDQHFTCYDASLMTALLTRCGAGKVVVVYNDDSLIVEAYR